MCEVIKNGLLCIGMCMLAALLAPGGAFAAEPAADKPSWTMDVGLGVYRSALDDWRDYYEDKPYFISFGVGYKVLRNVDVGLSVNHTRVVGDGVLNDSGAHDGDVAMRLVPVNLGVVFRGMLSEDQLLVPYIGGGFTKLFYHQKIEGSNSAQGSVSGRHVRVGLQLLLDPFDQQAATRLHNRAGVDNSYLTLEVQKIRAQMDGFDLGGKYMSLGVLLEY